MKENDYRLKRIDTLSVRIILWVGGCSLAVLLVVFLCMRYYNVPFFPLAAAILCLLVVVVVCWGILGYYMHPLNLLVHSAQRMAEGHHDERVPVSGRQDEIGQLQNSFAAMQHALADYIADLQQKRETLSEQNAKLQAAYEQAKEADSVKERFLCNMTEQMTRSVSSINTQAETLCNDYKNLSKADLAKLQVQILNDTETVTLLLNKMLNAS